MTPGWIDALDQIARDAEAKKQANVVTLSKGLRDALVRRLDPLSSEVENRHEMPAPR